MVTLVPEKRQELTTEGGLDVTGLADRLKMVIERLKERDIKISLFIDPEDEQILAAHRLRADMIEIHTGRYSDAQNEFLQEKELKKVVNCARKGKEIGMGVNAGHGLNYYNLHQIVAIRDIDELSIGHSIIARAVFVGLDRAVRDMLAIIRTYGG